MDLLQQVATTLKIEEGKAEKGIGAILTALRMTSDKTTFEAVKAAAPNSERWMGRALMSGGRTAEMTAPTNPTTLGAALASAGFKKDEIGTLEIGRASCRERGENAVVAVAAEEERENVTGTVDV